MGYSVCIDIGGTFTDCIVAAPDGTRDMFKAPSTPGAFERGFLEVLGLAAESYGVDLPRFLSQVDIIVHGTTVATNALVEGKAGRVGLVCNKGHPDILTLREAPKKRAFDYRLDYPEPFVPRHLTCEVGGRIDADGNEVTPLDPDDVRAAIAQFRRMEVEAIAVCLLWSIVNGDHERRVREIIRGEWPEVPITLSHELNPIPREYRRTMSTAVDAALHPVVSSYLDLLRRALRDAGYANELLVANCNGGMMPPDDIVRRPIYSVMSGPTLAPVAARRLTPEADVIVIDMGGTTFDVSAIRGGQLVVTPEAMIGPDMLGIPKVDVRSVGAGGGSIARVDVGGLLHVGPQSAGARPGPACYGLGGDRPTVTDANVVLGIIDPDFFLGGRIKLDKIAAEAAIGRIADQLGADLVDAAYAIHTTSNHRMIAAIEDITVREGINPRDSYLVAGGGATACHIAEMARELGIRHFMIPKFAAGLSAYGGLISDIRWEEVATWHTDHRRFALSEVDGLLQRLRERGRAFLQRAGVAPERRRFAYAFMGRYQYQSWEIEVPFELPEERLTTAMVDALAEGFHQMHERIYTFRSDQDVIEFTTWKVRAIGKRPADASRALESRLPAAGAPRIKSRRRVSFRNLAEGVELPVYDGDTLGAGAAIAGPAIIEEASTTILLLPEMEATTDEAGNYLLTIR
jgi:N-methylhydantoinase A